MTTLGEIAVNVVAHTGGFDSGMKRSRRELAGFADTAASVTSRLAGLVGITAGFGGLGFATKLAADAQSAEVGIENMIGSLEDTRALIAEINQFSAVTPFEPTELRQAAQSLLAYNFAADEIMPTLKTLGDVSAGSNTRLIELVNILGKVRDRGRVTAETLSEFGIRSASVMDSLAKQMGVSRSEVVKLASTGQISFNDLVSALKMMTTEGGLFAGAMAKQSETLNGKWSTLTGNVGQLAETIGSVLVPSLSRMLDVGNSFLGWLLEVHPTTWKFGLALVAAVGATMAVARAIPLVVAAYQTLSTIYTTLIAKQTFLNALAGPAGWVKIGVAIVAAGAATKLFYDYMGNAADETERITRSTQQLAAATEQAAAATSRLTKLREDSNSSAVRGLASAARRAELLEQHGLTITSRSLSGRNAATSAESEMLGELEQSNELLEQIESNTASGLKVREVSI